ncbi:Na+/H+ antiporter [Phytomonospora endophytica]|uniref:CPA1 family monovalent cation:H+ antiporter n=1 Tax=Phytomonospora endophytica TaxID=714109 RepID=A0A841FZL6_9ACTN|nr:Na+/H+ antiporter [Phytomonospora endophytica]MBB6038827.1 CPA1 family monovalent cation:H+ antiporter [Phytomonospora endophytica]GIG68377.1 putative Na(+)/H(+) exchanger [Phytomonospora endophytica]
MVGLELVVVLGVALLACHTLGRVLRIAPPILLLACGVGLGFVPVFTSVSLPPETMLLLFLPALLYWESLTTSLREIKRDARGILLMSTVLVVLTAAAVAAIAHAFGVPWGPAWVLGAAVAPTDATAVAALARSLPRRTVTVLRAESLVNDGTALVLYGVAVGVTVGEETFSLGHVSGMFAISYLGGALAGVLTAWTGTVVRRRIDSPILGNVAMIVIPFTAYLLAELVHASGVLAVVVCGLIISQVGPRAGRADTRLQVNAFWSLATFILNGALFVLVGLELPPAVEGLESVDIVDALIAVAVIYTTVIGLRFVFQFASAYTIRLLDRRPKQKTLRISNRVRCVNAVAGFRGAVSLAAALGVPVTLTAGGAFPDRDFIIFVTAGVIALTLVVNGLALPRLLRWARLPDDTDIDEEEELAETTAAEEAMAAIPDVAAGLGTREAVVDQTVREYEQHLAALHADDADDDAVLHKDDYNELRLALIARKRATVLRLRDEHTIDDTVLRRVQTQLDIEEARLSREDLVD